MERKTELTTQQKELFMQEAIAEAKKAEEKAEVPIGAIVVYNGKVIGRGYNQRETRQEAAAHAEMIAIKQANRYLNNWRLENCQLFVTLEPCPMCSGAILLSRISEVYYGPSDLKAGTAGTLMNLLDDSRFNHQAKVEKGILEEECRDLLQQFFYSLRKKKKEEKNKRRQNERGEIEDDYDSH